MSQFTPGAASQWVIERIQKKHERKGFSCGDHTPDHKKLNDFLLRFAIQNDRDGFGNTYVLVPVGQVQVHGYYTLIASQVSAKVFPPEGGKIAFPQVGVVLIGRLAVDVKSRGQRLGERLLMHALRRSEEISQIGGAYAVILRSLPESKAFYQKYGFTEFTDDATNLFILMRKVREMIAAARDDAASTST